MARLKDHQAAFLSQVLGGPQQYSGLAMRAAHNGRGISDADFNRVAGHLADTLRAAAVSEELIAEVLARVASLHDHIVTATPEFAY